MQFPEATKVDPLYRIDGQLYQRLPHATGQADPTAIRAALPIVKGEDAGGQRIGWFRALTKPLLSEGELESVKRIRANVTAHTSPFPGDAEVRLLVNLIDAMRERANGGG